MSESSLYEVKQYMEFLEGHTEFSVLSENALKPLIRMKDPEAQAKVVALVAKGGKRKQELYGTGKKMKAVVDRYDIIEPEKPKEKVKKLWNKVEQTEYTQSYVRTMIKNGVDPAVIRELVVKAIEVVGQE